jgi:hypothetical protein
MPRGSQFRHKLMMSRSKLRFTVSSGVGGSTSEADRRFPAQRICRRLRAFFGLRQFRFLNRESRVEHLRYFYNSRHLSVTTLLYPGASVSGGAMRVSLILQPAFPNAIPTSQLHTTISSAFSSSHQLYRRIVPRHQCHSPVLLR